MKKFILVNMIIFGLNAQASFALPAGGFQSKSPQVKNVHRNDTSNPWFWVCMAAVGFPIIDMYICNLATDNME